MTKRTILRRDLLRDLSRFRRRYWFVGMLLAFNGCGSSTQTETQREGREVIAISPETVVIERAANDDESAVMVSIKNVSLQPIDVSVSPASCACTLVVPLKASHLRPGESTELKLSGRPPVHGKTTTTFALKTSHPLLPLRQISVVLRGTEQPIPYVLSKPDSIQLSVHADQPAAKARWTVSCVESLAEEPWLRGITAEDSRIGIPDPTLEESLPTSDSTLIRHYSFEATFREGPNDAVLLRLPLKWKFRTVTAGDVPSILLTLEAVPYLRAVPEPVVIDISGKQLAPIEQRCLLFFDSETRQPIAFPEQFPTGVTVLVDSDLAKLPANASRLLLRIDPQSLPRSFASDSMSAFAIPVVVSNGDSRRGIINVRLIRP